MGNEIIAVNKNQLYPVFLKLHELKILLVGGGNVALEKLNSLLSNSPGAQVTIVAPVIREEVRELITQYPGCIIIERKFEEDDLHDKDMVICATDDKELHKQVRQKTRERKILINVADTPELCDFYLGSIVQKGNLKIAISTNGKSPTIAKRLKEVLHDVIPAEMEEILDNMQNIRNGMTGDFEEKVRRLNEITRVLSGNKTTSDGHE